MNVSRVLKLSVLALLAYSLNTVALPINALVSNSNNNVGFKIMRESSKEDKTLRNRLFSPISSHIALSMALNGTNGATRESFLKQLGYPTSILNEQINSQNNSLLNMLIRFPMRHGDGEYILRDENLPTVFTIQNSAWTTNGASTHKRYDFNKVYMKELADYYQIPQVTSLDFKEAKSSDLINEWVKKATQGMVPEIMSPEILNKLLWVLLSTSYLEAQWEYPFVAINDGVFTLANAQKISAPTMVRTTDSRLARSELADVAEINFRDSNIKAYVILPHTMNDFTALQNETAGVWTSTFWNSIFQNLQEFKVTLEMPKFIFKDEVLLKENEPLTKALNFNFLFKDNADFSRMDSSTSPMSKIGIIKQNTKIEWDEKGVKAAAATLVGGSERTSAPRPVQFIVDRPFYFAIYDSNSESFLYLGQVVDPR